MSEISITLTIADRPYRLKIDRQEEEMVRKAAKRINDKIAEYANSYAYKDKQDLLAMVALQYTTSSLNYENRSLNDENQITERLAGLDKILSENL